jgi:VWFA-related protein
MRTSDKWVLAGLLSSFCFTVFGVGQERPRTVKPQNPTAARDPAEDIVRVNTRVVFIDTLVKDKRTGEPVEGLKREDFEVLDNGRARMISYFGSERSDNRPLALLLVLAPLDDGAAKSLQTPEVINSLAAALEKLPSKDEVALMLVSRHGAYAMLTDLTHDGAKVTSALATLPKMDHIKTPPIRSVKVIQDAALSTALRRPGSQVRVVMVTDTVYLIEHADRDEMIRNMISANVAFNALITGTDKYLALLAPVLATAGNDLSENYDVPQYMAKQTGGHYVRARKKKDYGSALERVIGNLTARYSLGFILSDDELGDRQMHRLEVRVRARDSQGKERKLEVSARQGYYMPAK